MKKLTGIILCGAVILASRAFAAAPQVIGEYGDWTAYYYKEGKNSVCYMVSTPKKDEGKYSKRGNIYAVVTHRPAEKSFDVVNFDASYVFKSGAPFTVKIGHNTVSSFFTEQGKAWTLNEETDKKMVSLMKNGERMIVDGVSAKGTPTKDTYSLKGFTGAYKAISAKCKR